MTDQAQLKTSKSKRGGARPGAGKPKGYVHQAPLARKEAARAQLSEMVLRDLAPIVRAQMDVAKGISHFMLRDPETGQFRRLTEVAEIEQALNAPGASEGSTYWIYTKDPQTPAFTALMDRTIGKPVEEINTTLTINEPLAERIKKVKKKLGV